MGLLSFFFSEKPEVAVPKDVCYHIEGFLACQYFQNAMELADKLNTTSTKSNIQVEVTAHSRAEWRERLESLNKEVPGSQDHKTSPFIWEGCSGKPLRFIGGYDNYLHHCWKNHSAELKNQRA
ncbi:hypothetical protein DFQ26_007279 [Actinomortierella ambigua]|nr:hypothetical protein DFQ26_007279 [Actinomortierella ambigua]